MGGTGADSVRGIAVEAGGRIHVAGLTLSRDFPVVSPLPGQGTAPAGSNAFVATLAPSGAALAFASYLGGADVDEAHGIAVAADGGLVVAGETRSTDFPVLNARQPTASGLDGFVTKLSPAGALQWSTYHGGQASDSLFAVAADNAGGIAVAGASNSPDYPRAGSTPPAGGGFDGTISRFSSSGVLAPGIGR